MMTRFQPNRRTLLRATASTVVLGGLHTLAPWKTLLAQDKETYLTGAGGDPSGVWYPLAAEIAKLCAAEIPNVRAVGIPLSGADVQASIMAVKRNVSFWAAYPISVVDAAAGKQWPAHGNKVDVRSWFNAIHPYGSVVVAHENITSAEQLKGKVVNVMPEGHINFKITERHVLPIYGLSLDDIRPAHATPGEAVRLMKDGRIDGTVIGAGPGHPRIEELATFTEINLLPPPGGREAITTHAEKTGARYIYPMEIPQSAWPQLNLVGGEPSYQVGTDTMMAIGGWLDDELVYNMTKAVFENIDSIHAMHPIYSVSKETALQYLPTRVHAGALRYYEEHNFPGVAEHKERFPA